MKVRTSLLALAIAGGVASFSLAQIDANSTNCGTISPGVGQCMETESFAGIPNLDDTFLLDRFNPAWGTLQSVEVKVEISSSEGSLGVDNDSLEAGSGDIEFGIKGELGSSEVPLFTSSTNFNSQFGNDLSTVATSAISLTGDDGDQPDQGVMAAFNTGGTDFSSFTPPDATDTDSGLIAAAFINDFLLGAADDSNNNGAVDFDLEASQFSDFGALGGVAAQIIPQNITANVMLTYTYEPVPEPQAWALISGAAMLLMSFRKRR